MCRCVGDCSCPTKTPYSQNVSTQESWVWVMYSPPALCGTQALLSCSNMWFVYVFVLVHKCSTCVAFTAAEGASHMLGFHTLGPLFYPLTQHYSTWKFRWFGGHVCFSLPSSKHNFVAACKDESHACRGLVPPPPRHPPNLIHFPTSGYPRGENHFNTGMFFAYGHHRLVVTDINEGSVDQAL